jgi:rhodanese-related sulfurtransferase
VENPICYGTKVVREKRVIGGCESYVARIGRRVAQFDFVLPASQNPLSKGDIMPSKFFLILGLVPMLAMTFNAQTNADAKEKSSTVHQLSPRFLQIVNESRKRVRETSVEEVKARQDRGEKFTLIDVREESEFAKDHLPGAIHLGKGVIERDIEEKVPDLNAPIVLYCGGGYRSTLAADNLQKMGYSNVLSMDGGIRVWREKGFPLAK